MNMTICGVAQMEEVLSTRCTLQCIGVKLPKNGSFVGLAIPKWVKQHRMKLEYVWGHATQPV